MPEASEHVRREQLNDPVPHVHLLSNGRYTVLVTGAGGGFSTFDGLALTRWAADRTCDADGYFLYVRDRDSGLVWSAGQQPVGCPPEHYAATFDPGKAEITRLDEGVETCLEVCVPPADDVELRRCTLTNHSSRPRRLDVTSYAEVVLNTPAADAAHPAFSKLFVQTEVVAGRPVLLARRRLRSPDDVPGWLGHWLVGTPAEEADTVTYETDRMRFIGRGCTRANPRALAPGAGLSGSVGNVLDPVVSLRRAVVLAPGARVQLTFGMGAGSSRAAVEALEARYREGDAVERAFVQAAEEGRRVAHAVEGPAGGPGAFQRLTGALFFDDPGLRLPASGTGSARLHPEVLPAYGPSGTRPLLVARLDDEAALDTVRLLGRAQACWRRSGLSVDLLILDDTPAGDGLEDTVRDVVAANCTGPVDEAAGGVFIHRTNAIPPADLAAIEAVARAVIRSGLPLVQGKSGVQAGPGPSPRFRPASWEDAGGEDSWLDEERLLLDNGYGGFTDDGQAYVIRIQPGDEGLRLPPLPWTHVVANEHTGFLATEAGAGTTWSLNSRENRLTPWYNDPVSDPHGEALYVRDDEAGLYWSPTPGPVPQRAGYEVRYGFGYARYRHRSHGLTQEVHQFVPRHDPVKITQLRLTNTSGRARRLTVFQYQRWVLGGLPEQSARYVITSHDPGTGAVFAVNPCNHEFAQAVAFAVAAPPPGRAAARVTADRTAFLGCHGSTASPAALASAAPLDGRTGAGLDPCAAFEVPLTLAPGETVVCTFLLGEAGDREAARALATRYSDPTAVTQAFDAVQAFWQGIVSAVQVETPSPAIDLMLNGWLLYQGLACRLWGRSAYYQSGGAFGFRDQLQDATALVYARPEMTRAQLLLHAAHQFVEGDVMHWWHPPTSKGIRTRFSDDLLWLPYVTAFYLRATGDHAILDEPVRFLKARALEDGEDEAFLVPEDAGEGGTLYEHCCRALDRSLTQGAHGLPLMGSGDWNDGMNRVGRGGRGESVWVGFFLYDILRDVIPLCEARGDGARAQRYAAYRVHLEQVLNTAGWDGGWYRRAYYDDGTPLGAAENDECRIDALAQAWAVISKAAPPFRAARAMDAMVAHLVSEQEGLIRLLTPPFDRTPHDPGYIKGYLPGVRENGGQYTHAAVWAVRALAEAGRGGHATRLLEMLSPVSHTRTPEAVAVYQVEPYVVAADVYGVAPHVGRGGWTWYTGSAGWLYRVALETILGLTLRDGRTLVLAPRVPAAWPGYRLRYRRPDSATVYEIEVRNPTAQAGRVASADLDGAAVPIYEGAAQIPLVHDGAVHHVRLMLGAATASPPSSQNR